jgi:hypothetical protein
MDTNFIKAEKSCYDIKVSELRNLVMRNIMHQKKEGICVQPPKEMTGGTISIEDAKNKDIPSELLLNQNQMYLRSWNKLEKGLKLNRIREYLSKKKSEWNMSNSLFKKLEKDLNNKIHRKLLSKKSEVKYDEKNGEIESIPSLTFTEDDNGKIIKYTFEKKKRKTRERKSKNGNV